jgi:hypothetical protein
MLRLSIVLLLLSACSAAFDGRTYRGDGFAFRITSPPPQWQRIDDAGAALAFRDLANDATIMVNGRCGEERDDVPLESLTQHLFLMFTERTVHEQKVEPFDGREAMHTVMSAELDGVPMRYDVWVTKKDGCVYDLLYFAPPDRFERGLPAFQGLVQSFTSTVPHDD